MFGSDILDVAVGLVFMFLMLSLMCSALNELFEGARKNRARDLERGIREMLADPNAAGIVPKFYNHPLISGLFQGSYDPKSKSNLPTYVPARTFAIALMDVLQPATANSLSGAAATAQPGTGATLQDFRKTLAAMPDTPVRTAILSLVDAAGNDASKARQNIEDWYNSAMDRVSGWYKRRTQIIVAGLGLALAVFVNADTIGFARYLSTNTAARALIVSRAEAVRPAANAPGAGSTVNALPSSPTPAELVDSLGWLQRETGIPFGWRTKPQKSANMDDATFSKQLADYNRDWRKFPEDPPDWISKFFGLLLTTLAVSLGAPFWFDVLNKFMVVRSTIKPKEKSPDEPSKS